MPFSERLPAAEWEAPGCPVPHRETLTPALPPSGWGRPCGNRHCAGTHWSRAGCATAPYEGGEPSLLEQREALKVRTNQPRKLLSVTVPPAGESKGRCGGPAVAPTFQTRRQVRGLGFWVPQGQHESLSVLGWGRALTYQPGTSGAEATPASPMGTRTHKPDRQGWGRRPRCGALPHPRGAEPTDSGPSMVSWVR